MGKGKGAVDHYVAVIKPGRILFEVAGCRGAGNAALEGRPYKLPIKTKMVAGSPGEERKPCNREIREHDVEQCVPSFRYPGRTN